MGRVIDIWKLVVAHRDRVQDFGMTFLTEEKARAAYTNIRHAMSYKYPTIEVTDDMGQTNTWVLDHVVAVSIGSVRQAAEMGKKARELQREIEDTQPVGFNRG